MLNAGPHRWVGWVRRAGVRAVGVGGLGVRASGVGAQLASLCAACAWDTERIRGVPAQASAFVCETEKEGRGEREKECERRSLAGCKERPPTSPRSPSLPCPAHPSSPSRSAPPKSAAGFHTFDYARHFLSCCARMLGLEHKTSRGSIIIEYYGRDVGIKIMPTGEWCWGISSEMGGFLGFYGNRGVDWQ